MANAPIALPDAEHTEYCMIAEGDVTAVPERQDEAPISHYEQGDTPEHAEKEVKQFPAAIWQWQERTVTQKLGWIDMDPGVCAKLNAAMHDFYAVSPGPDDPLPVVYYTDKGGSRKWCADLKAMTQTRCWPEGAWQGATSKIRQITVLLD